MGPPRSLAAILFTDIVGYTAVVARSEAEALALRERHRKLVGEAAARFRGRFFEETGDESLSTFASASDAVGCALAIQEELASDPGLSLRVGVHLGEVLEQDGHLIGDAVNVAARVRPLAEPGGVCVSSRVWENVRNLAGVEGAFLGDKKLKNVPEPVGVWVLKPGAGGQQTTRRRTWLRVAMLGAGSLFLLVVAFAAIRPAREAVLLDLIRRGAIHVFPSYEQEIRFTTAPDGVRLAWASIGEGPPVVVVSGWASHLERGLGSPGRNIVVPVLMGDHRVIVYDGRGFGLSDRGVEDFSLSARVGDLTAVMDAAGAERAGLLALSSAALPAVAFAARYPERVERLFVYGGGTRFGYHAADPSVRERSLLLAEMLRAGGWSTPAFRSIFTALFLPDADPFAARAFDEMQRVAGDDEDVANFLDAVLADDLSELAPGVRAPTRTVHLREDQIVPYAEGRRLASLIPGAELVTLEGRNHALSPGEPAMEGLHDQMADFFRIEPAP